MNERLDRHDREALRNVLARRHDELCAEIRDAQAVHPPGVERTEVSDRKDDALRLEADEIDAAQEERDVVELQQVEQALHRLRTGTYGDCIDCGAPIGAGRLRAQPAAERCGPCQTTLERDQHTTDRCDRSPSCSRARR